MQGVEMELSGAGSVHEQDPDATIRHTRREFLEGAAGVAVLAGSGRYGSVVGQAGPRPLVGMLWYPEGIPEHLRESFLRGLRELPRPLAIGEDFDLVFRFGGWDPAALRRSALELAALPVALIIAGDSTSVHAAKQATSTIPIIMAISGDPIGEGHIVAPTLPGRNITGLTNRSRDTSRRRLELLLDALPWVSSVAVLGDPDSPSARLQWQEIQAAAASKGVRIQTVEVRTRGDFAPAFAAIRSQAVLVLSGPLTTHHRVLTVDLAARYKLPTMHGVTDAVKMTPGGLMAYGPDRDVLAYRLAHYVYRILRDGDHPSRIPVEAPNKFEFVINQDTVTDLGISIPGSVLAQATIYPLQAGG